MSSVAGKTLADFPDILKQWHPTKNGDLEPGEIAGGSNKYFWWKCDKGPDHEWETKVNHRTSGARCPFCTGRKVLKSTSLAFHYPTVSQYWHLTKNGDLTPEQVTKSSNRKVWWRCTKDPNHIWQAVISNFVRLYEKNKRSSLCRLCPKQVDKNGSRKTSMKGYGRKTLNDFPEILKEWDYTKNSETVPEGIKVIFGSRRKVWWKCNKGPDHEWRTQVYMRVSGRGCPYCAGKKVSVTNSLASLYPEIAKEWHPTKNGELSPDRVTWGSSRRKIWWKCDKGSDHEWETSISNRTTPALRTKCPYCVGRKASVTNSLASLYPEIAKEWHPSKNGELSPDKVTFGSRRKVWWKCDKGPDHEWANKINSRTSMNTWCPFCAGQKLSVTNCLAIQYPELAMQWHPTKNGKLRPEDVTVGMTKRVWWQCPRFTEHEWQVSVTHRIKTDYVSDCPHCNLIPRSKQEIRIAFELLSFFDFEITSHKTKILGKIFDVDIRLNKPKLIIEFDGAYWHRDRMSNDIEKTQTLLKGGWKVIRIREDPLETITPNDISVSQHCSVKEVMDLLLPTIEKVCNIKIDGLREYLRLKNRVNKEAAEKYIIKLLRDKEQTTLDVD
jgi:hypothetical protein